MAIQKLKNGNGERQQMEALLKESENRFRLAIDTVPAMIWTATSDKLCDYFNKVWLDFTGRSPEQERGLGWSEAVHPSYRQQCADTYLKAFDDGEKFEMEYRLRRYDGEYRWILMAGVPRYGADGSFAGYIGSATDISDRKHLEAALSNAYEELEIKVEERTAKLNNTIDVLKEEIKECQKVEAQLRLSEERLCSIVDRAVDAFFIQDGEGRIIDVNQQACDSLGYSRSELLDLSVRDIEITLELKEMKKFWQEITLGNSYTVGGIYRRKDRTIFPVEVRLGKVEWGGNQYVLALARDITDRKLAEAALNESNERFQAFLDNSPAVIYIKDTEGRYTLANRRLETLLNLKAEQIVGKTDRDLFPAEIAATCQASDREVLEIGTVLEFEEVLQQADGMHTFLSVKFPLKHLDGTPYAMCGISTDISDRKFSEEALRLSEERLQRALEANKDGLWDWNVVTGDCYISPRWKEILGYSVDEISGHIREWESRLHPHDKPYVVQVLNEHFEGTRSSFAAEYRMQIKSGEWKWILNHGKVVERDENGSPLRMTGTHRDISDRKQTEEILRQKEEFLRTIYDNVDNVIFVVDVLENGDFNYAGVNRVCERNTGISNEDFCSKTPEEIFGLEMGSCMRQTYVDCRQTGTSISFEERLTMQGEDSWWMTSLTPLQDASGIVYRIIGTSHDITERKRAQEERDRFFNLALDINTILRFDGYFEEINPACEKSLGFSKEELLAKPIIEFIHPEDREATFSEVQKNFVGTSTLDLENRILCKDGSYKWFLWQAVPLVEQQKMYAFGKDITDRKQTEKMLREQEQFLRSIYDGVEYVIFVVDIREDGDFRYVGVNPAGERNSGFSSEYYCGKTLEEVFGLEMGLFWRQRFENCLKAGVSISFEEQIILKDVHTWWNATLTPLRDAEGSMYRIIGTSHEITQRKQVEEERDRFFNSSQDIICTAGFDGYFRELNPATERILGFSKEEMLAKPFIEFVHPDDRKATVTEITKMTEGETILAFENRYLCKDGSYKWLLWQGVPYPEWQIIYATGKDIDERKQTEEVLRSNERILRVIFDRSFQFIGLLKPDGILLKANQTSLDAVQVELKDVVGHFFWETPWWGYSLEAQNRLKAAIEEAARGNFVRYESVDSGDLDRALAIDFSLKPVFDETGEVVLLIAEGRDITEFKRTEEALRESEARSRQQTQQIEQTLRELQQTQTQLIQTEKMSSLGQLVAGVAHEINNPVSFIYGNISPAMEYIQDLLHLLKLYQKYYPNPVEEIQEYIEEIDFDFLVEDLPKTVESMKIGANRIREIVLSLRNFSRLDEAETKAVNIHEGIDNTLLILRNRLKETGKQLGIKIIKKYGNLPNIDCYAGQINQVFMNILTNAIDALDEYDEGRTIEEIKLDPSTIQIATELFYRSELDAIDTEMDYTSFLIPKNSQWVAIRIKDNGPGMSEQVRRKLFDPFFTTKPVGKGTGLGLSISYQIVVEKHGGQLYCNSAPGQGAEFVIEIPIDRKK